MPPVVEVYNRVVQCQANQRQDRRVRRRRHLSEQSIKTEMSPDDVSRIDRSDCVAVKCGRAGAAVG